VAINEKDPRVVAMRKLKYSDEQVEEMLEDDKAVDRNEPLPWDMSKEDHKKAMKYANADEHKKPVEKKSPTVYNWDTTDKPKKQNITKEALVSALAEFLRSNTELACENVEITNKQGKISFKVGENDFSFSLTQHRKK
jgi:Fic family protein